MKTYKVKVNDKVYEVELESVTESNKTIKSEEKAPVKEPVEKKVSAPSNGAGVPLLAPIQGTVLQVKVAAGDSVKKGQTLVVIEAMKLENEIVAPQDGVVKEIKVSKGQTVNSKDQLLILA